MGELQNIAGVNAYDSKMIETEQAFFLEVFGTLFLLLTVLSTINEKEVTPPHTFNLFRSDSLFSSCTFSWSVV